MLIDDSAKTVVPPGGVIEAEQRVLHIVRCVHQPAEARVAVVRRDVPVRVGAIGVRLARHRVGAVEPSVNRLPQV
jgi:hypothetical protein